MRVGLLPLYIALYDETSPGVRPRLEGFYEKIATQIEEQGIEVIRTADFCRLKPEFEEAVAKFESEEADAIITLHMAYSPSLESIEALVKTELPIIVLDTTETLEFSPEKEDGSEVMYNHGIHGVMDMCSMLKRYGKEYGIAAGHYKESDVVERACGLAKAAVAAKALQGAKVGIVGGAFEGMGDFKVDPKEFKERFGATLEDLDAGILGVYKDKISKEDLEKELQSDLEQFDFAGDIDWKEYTESVLYCLAMRACIEDKGYTAFSVNFRQVNKIPFMECCKAMARGIGYAGEGDGLTAAFAGALMTTYPETGFVEIFCPDWKNNLLYLSHMGEVNYATIDTKPYVRKVTGFVDTHAGYARMKGGKGVYVNISRGKDNYQLTIAPAEMLSCESDIMPTRVRGWMKPEERTTAEFLESHSRVGATHHSIFVYGASVEEMVYFGKLLGMDTVVI